MQAWTDAELVEKAKTALNPHVSSFENPADHSHLPFVDTRFVGREAELKAVLAHFEQAHLISLVGPGGIGKTRLAIQVAIESLDQFANGVYFISLLAIHTPEALPAAIFRGMHAPCYDADVESSLLNYLQEKSTLLIMDNYEHLLPHVELLREIIEQGPYVRVLVTSRERLNMHAEWTLPIAGLHFSETEMPVATERYSAAQLFLQSAQKACVNFSLRDDEKPSVMRICQLVQGHPLAIELAAAWTRTLSCREIAQEIIRDVDFLATTWRDFPTRHQSIRAVFEYSWGLLTPEERQSFLKLQVFQGGFRKDAALQVAGVSLQTLTALIDKSFLSRNPTTQRYEIHELLRQYASRQLDADLSEVLRQAHCVYFCAAIQQNLDALLTTSQPQLLQDMRQELSSLLSAWRWAAEHGKVEQVDQGMEGLFQFYEIQGWFREGHAVFADAVAALQASEDATTKYARLIARLLARQGQFSYYLGMYKEAEALTQTSLEIASAAGNIDEVAFCLINLASIAEYHSQYTQTIALYQRVLDLACTPENRALQARALCGMGVSLFFLGNKPLEAATCFEQGLELYRACGRRRGEGMALHGLGMVMMSQGEYGQAKRYCEQALQIRIETGDRRGQIVTLNNLGIVFTKCGEYAQAQTCFERTLSLSKEIGYHWLEATALHHLGSIHRHLGRNKEAYNCYSQALRFNIESNNDNLHAYTLMHMGHALLGLQKFDEAHVAYQQSLEVRRRFKNHQLIAESLAGLAHLYLCKDDVAEALNCTEKILTQIQSGDTLTYADEPLQIHLTCYEVLRAAGDARAASILTRAHELLQQQVNSIDDPALRRSLLENVSAHREIRQHFALLSEQSLPPAPSALITARESEVLALLAAGLSNKEIAGRLFISLSTVKHHIWHIYGKLDAQSRTQAVKHAQELGILAP